MGLQRVEHDWATFTFTFLGKWYHPSWELVPPFLGTGMNHPHLVMAKGLVNSMKPWAMQCRANQDGRVIAESSDKTWSTGGGNGKPPQYTCRENIMNCIKGQKDKAKRWVPQLQVSKMLNLYPSAKWGLLFPDLTIGISKLESSLYPLPRLNPLRKQESLIFPWICMYGMRVGQLDWTSLESKFFPPTQMAGEFGADYQFLSRGASPWGGLGFLTPWLQFPRTSILEGSAWWKLYLLLWSSLGRQQGHFSCIL